MNNQESNETNNTALFLRKGKVNISEKVKDLYD